MTLYKEIRDRYRTTFSFLKLIFERKSSLKGECKKIVIFGTACERDILAGHLRASHKE